MLELRQIRTLIAAAESATFAEAAARLFVTPAAVSQQLAQLERELGVSLFDRSSRPPTLTAMGELLLEKGRTVLQGLDDFVATATGSQAVRGRLLLGSISGITSDLLPETLVRLRGRFPNLRIRIEEGVSQLLVRRVQRRELDAAIVNDSVDIPAQLDARPLLREPLVAVAAGAAPDVGWRELLADRPFLRLNRQSGVGRVIDHHLRRAGIRIEEAMELDSTETVIQMALAGLGVGVVPAGRVQAEARQRLTVTPFGSPQVYRQLVLVRHHEHAGSEHAELLYQALQECLPPAA